MAKFEEEMPNVNINNDNLRRSTRNKKPTKQYKPTMTGQQYENSFIQILQHICASQYSLKAGIKKIGDKGEKGALKEMEQLHYRNTFACMK